MSNSLSAILVASNVLLAAAVTFQAFRVGSSGNPAGAAVSSGAEAGAAAILTSLNQIDKSLARQAESTVRLNTSLVQYDFLQKELERLARLDQALAVRANAITAARTEKNEGDSNKALDKIKEVQNQVQSEVQRRKETLLKLIAGLEKNLAATSLDEKAVKEALKSAAPKTGEEAASPADGASPLPAAKSSDPDHSGTK